MKSTKILIVALIAALAASCFLSVAHASTTIYSDDFEAGSKNAAWTGDGTLSTSHKHGGAKSLALEAGGEDQLDLSSYTGSTSTWTLDFWWYCDTDYPEAFIVNAAEEGNTFLWVACINPITFEEPPIGGFSSSDVWAVISIVGEEITAVNTTQAYVKNYWNHFHLVAADGDITVYINGGDQGTYACPLTIDRSVIFDIIGDEFLNSTYIDDFTLTDTTVKPSFAGTSNNAIVSLFTIAIPTFFVIICVYGIYTYRDKLSGKDLAELILALFLLGSLGVVALQMLVGG